MPPGERAAAAKGWECFLFPARWSWTQCNLQIIQVHMLRGWQSTHMLCCVCSAYIQCAAWASWCMLNDCAFRSVYIYPWWQVGMCERWEVRNPTRRQIHTGRRTHTSPRTWTEIFTHHTQTTAPTTTATTFFLSPPTTSVCTSFPLFSHTVSSSVSLQHAMENMSVRLSLCCREENDADSSAKK